MQPRVSPRNHHKQQPHPFGATRGVEHRAQAPDDLEQAGPLGMTIRR
jgi:hypothetical protein